MRIVLCDEEHISARIDPLEFDLVEILRTNWFDMWSEAELRLWEVARSGKSWRAIFFLLSDGCQPYRCSGLMKVRLVSWSMFLLKPSYAVPWDQTETCDLQMDSPVAPMQGPPGSFEGLSLMQIIANISGLCSIRIWSGKVLCSVLEEMPASFMSGLW